MHFKNYLQKRSTLISMMEMIIKWRCDVSVKILKALCYEYNERNANKFYSDDSDYLYFWLGDLLDRNSLYTVMGTLNFLLKNNSHRSICNYDKYDKYHITYLNFMDIKTLFDFSKDYETLKPYFLKPNKSCNHSFEIYLDECVTKYNSYKNRNNDLNCNDDICNPFNDYFNGKNNMDLNNWKCNSVHNADSLGTGQRNLEVVSQSLAQEESHGLEEEVVTQQVVCGTREQENAYEIVNEAEDQGNFPESVHMKQVKGDAEVSPQVRTTQENLNQQGSMTSNGQISAYKHNNDSANSIRDSEFGAFSDFLHNPSTSSSSKSMVIASLVIGIIVLSIILGKKRNIIMNKNIKDDYTMPEDLYSRRSFNVTYSNIYYF
ncbi:variable surface protein [Plasmodium gonderi]|uniref:Variable surface protein n=1 Tax=Plasmodium gonderi TaxID=77519 RepID=A0A1Y1JUS2_PLAGO|nr:variable surface protein [Plasmodium gonderi]GAW84492.1 variable surface protein [Plasmodium gonderi]